MDRHTMSVVPEVVEAIRSFIGAHPAERGGMLGCDATGRITHFFADIAASANSTTYIPNTSRINAQIQAWERENVRFCGFVHSHPRGVMQPSGADRQYAGDILDTIKRLEKLWLPIVMTVPDSGQFHILPFAAVPHPHNRKDVDIVAATLSLSHAGVSGNSHASKIAWLTGLAAGGGTLGLVMKSRSQKPEKGPEKEIDAPSR